MILIHSDSLAQNEANVSEWIRMNVSEVNRMKHSFEKIVESQMLKLTDLSLDKVLWHMTPYLHEENENLPTIGLLFSSSN